MLAPRPVGPAPPPKTLIVAGGVSKGLVAPASGPVLARKSKEECGGSRFLKSHVIFAGPAPPQGRTFIWLGVIDIGIDDLSVPIATVPAGLPNRSHGCNRGKEGRPALRRGSCEISGRNHSAELNKERVSHTLAPIDSASPRIC